MGENILCFGLLQTAKPCVFDTACIHRRERPFHVEFILRVLHEIWLMEHWDVFFYKSVSDLIVTIVQLRNINFMGRNRFVW